MIILWCGFVGAWLLVAGPIYQAALELDEQDLQRDELVSAFSSVQGSDRVSPWWWLLPPVGYWLRRQQAKRDRAALLMALTHEQLEGFVRYKNKATGWMFVALGALLISVKETAELAEHYEWPTYVVWLVVVVMAALCAINTAATMIRSRSVLGET